MKHIYSTSPCTIQFEVGSVLNKRAFLIIGGVAAVSVISGVIVWQLLFGGGDVTQYGLGGVFLVSLLSHATMVARDIFVPLFLVLSRFYNPLILGAAAGIGGAIGDLVPYVLGLGLAETVSSGVKSKAEETISRWINRYGLWAILLVSMTPLPDMPVIMLAGTRRLPFKKLLLIEAFGKTILYTIAAYVGGTIFEMLIGAVGGLWAQSLVIVGSVIFCFVLTWPPSRDVLFGFAEKLITTSE
jgi:membrane protein YqaA with SNARE-associated domain